MIRTVLADDQTLIRQGVRSLLALTPDITVVGEASGGVEAVAMIAELRPDVALLDVRMPDCTGIEVLRRCRAAGFVPATILLTTFDDDAAFRDGLEAGMLGYLLKD